MSATSTSVPMEPTHFCTRCLKKTNEELEVSDAIPAGSKLVLPTSVCTSPGGGAHSWSLMTTTTTQGVSDALITELRNGMQALAFNQGILSQKLPAIIDCVITPSTYNKSTKKEAFLDVIDMFGFGRANILPRAVDYSGGYKTDLEQDFTFIWSNDKVNANYKENASYLPLQQHLTSKGITSVIVGSGEGLPDGLLYYEELWTLRNNTGERGQTVVFKYILKGRTDLVIKKDAGEPLGKSNNRYFIEIKTGDINEDALREAVLQLIGGNASNNFHSPPVLLTDLNKAHYVLHITPSVGERLEKLKFKLNVVKMPSFGVALRVVEEMTVLMLSVTQNFGRKPSPPSTPPRANRETDQEEELTENFSSVQIDEVVEDTEEEIDGDAKSSVLMV